VKPLVAVGIAACAGASAVGDGSDICEMGAAALEQEPSIKDWKIKVINKANLNVFMFQSLRFLLEKKECPTSRLSVSRGAKTHQQS
jgi:hypothetical protein